MSENLENNPFSALFGSLNEAGTFSRQQRQYVSGVENTVKGIPEADSSVSDVEDCTIPIQATECLEVNQLVEDVFHLTLNNNSHIKTSIINELVFLEELASALAPQDWIDIDTLELALFERLLLKDPENHVIGRSVDKELSPTNAHATQKEVIPYLFECHRRLLRLKTGVQNNGRNKIISQMLSLLMRNAATALKQPELFESQQLHSQILQLVCDDSILEADLDVFFDGLVQQFVLDDGEDGAVDKLRVAFSSSLDTIHKDIAQSKLFTFNHSYFSLLHIFSSRSQLGSVLIAHSTPKVSRVGLSYADTLLGSILSLSCLPKKHDGHYDFFGKPDPQAVSFEQGNIWTATEAISENVYKIFYSLLKCSNEVRHQTLCWIADCLQANVVRGQLWNDHGWNLEASACVSDGFMLNLGAVLLRLCQPFCSDTADSKLLRIDPTYCAAKVDGDDEVCLKGVHMKKLASETCLIPAPEDAPRPLSETFSFVTECFYLAHKALDLGFRVTFRHLTKTGQDIAHTQRAYTGVQNQAGASSEVVQAVDERMEMEGKR
jgi:ubiquitin conjugation factor E4 A